MQENTPQIPVQTPSELFPDTPQLIPCTSTICTNGHKSKPRMVVFDCPECKTPALVMKMENCPICNEPISKVELRVDVVPKGAGVARRCRGEQVYGESMTVDLERTKYRETEQSVA